MFCIHQPGHFHRRAQKWSLSDAKPRQITFICASVSRILVLLRTLPPTRRHLSLWVPSPTRSSELCAPVATLTRTSHLSSSSYVRRKASEGGGVAIHADICTTYTPQCPLSHYAQEKLWARPEAQICEPINILYVDTCPLIANSYFLFKGLPLHGRNAKIDLRSVSRDTIWVSLLQRGVENEEEEVHIYVYWCYWVVF